MVISVQDEGQGIPEPLHGKVFERFFQVDGSNRRRSGGVGMGLYVCRQMADLVRARLWLERSDEHGSLCCLSLAAARLESSRRPNGHARGPAAVEPEPANRS